MKIFSYLLKLILPEHAVIPLVGIFVGTTLALGQVPPLELLILPFVSFIFLVWGFNASNAIFDLNADRINKPKRPLPSAELTMKQVFLISLSFYFIGLIIAFIVSEIMLIISLTFIAFCLIYSVPPIRMKAWPFGINITGGIIYGVLPLLVGYTLINGMVIPGVFIVYVFLMTAIFSSVKDFEDRIGDSVQKVRSLPVIYGEIKTAKILSLSIIILTFLFSVYAFNANLPRMTFAAVIGIVIALIFSLYLLKNIKKMSEVYLKDIVHQSNMARVCILNALVMEGMYGIVFLF